MKNTLQKIKNHPFKKNTKVVFFITIFILLMNILAIICHPFAKFYRKYIFHYCSTVMSGVMGLFRISVGEVMICIGIGLIILAVIIFILGFIKMPVFKKIRKYFFRFIVYVLVFIYFTETFHCFMLYHAGTLKKELVQINQRVEKGTLDNAISTDIYEMSGVELSPVSDDSKISDIEKLLLTYNHVTVKINELSVKMKRKSNGDLVNDYTYNECKSAMHHTSKYYPLLKGYYPNPKKIYFSDLMSQQYLAGIYFPFSMEANYNQIMYCSNYPSVICHELSHLKGYIREDEANFIAYVACINSDNDFIKYSGYLSVYYYLENDLYEYGDDSIHSRMQKLNDFAKYDNIFLKEEDFERIEENAVISTEKLSEATDQFLDSNLKMNGVSSGMDNYNEVVKLLIFYYGLI